MTQVYLKWRQANTLAIKTNYHLPDLNVRNKFNLPFLILLRKLIKDWWQRWKLIIFSPEFSIQTQILSFYIICKIPNFSCLEQEIQIPLPSSVSAYSITFTPTVFSFHSFLYSPASQILPSFKEKGGKEEKRQPSTWYLTKLSRPAYFLFIWFYSIYLVPLTCCIVKYLNYLFPWYFVNCFRRDSRPDLYLYMIRAPINTTKHVHLYWALAFSVKQSNCAAGKQVIKGEAQSEVSQGSKTLIPDRQWDMDMCISYAHILREAVCYWQRRTEAAIK